MNILIEKKARKLTLMDEQHILHTFDIALGKCPEHHKEREGDNRTPEGDYYICTRNDKSKFHLALGLSYPNAEDADAALLRHEITSTEHQAILTAHRMHRRPPWDTNLGGFIMIHGGGIASDWTAGCIALENADIEILFALCPLETPVRIVP